MKSTRIKVLMRYIVRAIFTRFGIWLIIESEIYRCHTDVDSGVVFAEYGVDKVFHNNHRPCPERTTLSLSRAGRIHYRFEIEVSEPDHFYH